MSANDDLSINQDNNHRYSSSGLSIDAVSSNGSSHVRMIHFFSEMPPSDGYDDLESPPPSDIDDLPTPPPDDDDDDDDDNFGDDHVGEYVDDYGDEVACEDGMDISNIDDRSDVNHRAKHHLYHDDDDDDDDDDVDDEDDDLPTPPPEDSLGKFS